MSGRRDSNPRPLAWKANALSTELLPLTTKNYKIVIKAFGLVGRAGFEPTKAMPTDLQSAPFDRFGIFPFLLFKKYRTRCFSH